VLEELEEQQIEKLIDKMSRYTEIEEDKEKREELGRKVKEYIERKGKVDIVAPVLPSYPPWPPHMLLYQKLSEIQDSLVKIHVVWGYSFLKAHTELAYHISYIERFHKALMKVFNVDIGRIEFVVDSDLIDLYYNKHRLSELFRNIVNSINIENFYKNYLEKRSGKGFYQYYSKRPKVGGPMISDLMSMLATIFYAIEDLQGGIVIVGRDKDSIIDYLRDLLGENPYAKEYIKYLDILYLPEIEAFYKIRENEPQLPGPEDSRDDIKKRLRHCDAKDLETLIKLHCRDEKIRKNYCGLEDITAIEKYDYNKLIDILSQFYFKVYEDMKRNVGVYGREIKFTNRDDVKKAIEVLSKPRLDILGIIYRKYMEDERGIRLIEIQRNLRVEGGNELGLSTIKYHIDILKSLGLVEELKDSEGKTAYKPSYSKIVIEIDLQKMFG